MRRNSLLVFIVTAFLLPGVIAFPDENVGKAADINPATLEVSSRPLKSSDFRLC